MILDEHLKSWLIFEASSNQDAIRALNWTDSYGSNADTRRGKAYKASGSYLSTTASADSITLGGEDFTFDGWFKCRSTTATNAQPIVNVKDVLAYTSSSGQYLFDLVVDTPSNNREIKFLCSNTSAASNDYTTYSTGVNVTLEQWYYYAIVYEHAAGTLTLYIDGVEKAKHTCSYTSKARYPKYAFDYGISSTRQLYGALDDLCIYAGKALYTGAHQPPANSFYENLTIYSIDTMRRVLDHDVWRYENNGTADGLINTMTAETVKVPTEVSASGQALYQPERIKVFDVPSTDKEIWIKFDVYYDGLTRWRCYNIGSQEDGLAVTANSSTTTSSVRTQVWINGSSTDKGFCQVRKRQTYLIHIVAGASDGLIEFYTNYSDGYYSRTGNVNSGNPFTALYLQSDGAGTVFSNIIISNEEILWEENLSMPIAFELVRLTHDDNEWRYRNKGEISDLINTTTAAKVDNLPAEKSVTGSAFYQTTQKVGIFDVPAVNEVWIRFDVYSNANSSYYAWRVGDYSKSTSSSAVLSGLIVEPSDTGGNIGIYYGGNTNFKVIYGVAKRRTLQSFILHMKASSTSSSKDGLVEVFSADSGLIYRYVGTVNQGAAFSALSMQQSGYNDNTRTYFSNVVISNGPLWFDDSATGEFAVEYLANTERHIEKEVSLFFDTKREINAGTSVSFYADAERVTYNTIAVNLVFDAERIVGIPVTLAFDLSRTIINVAIWRYENIGTIDDLLNVSDSAVQLDVPLSQSWTGKAFYNGRTSGGVSNRSVKMFPISDTDRIWIKFDVYRPAYDDNYAVFEIRDEVYVDSIDDPLHGKSSAISVTSVVNGDLQIWDIVYQNQGYSTVYIDKIDDILKDNEKQTFIVHWQADAECGTFEVYTKEYGLVFTHYAMMHAGQPFKQINLNTSSFNRLNSYFSNIVISNGKLDFDDNVSLPVSFLADAERKTVNEISFYNDTERVLLYDSFNVVYTVDAVRLIDISKMLLFDSERIISHDFPLNILIYMDTERDINAQFVVLVDAQRYLSALMNMDADVQRQVGITVVFTVDTMRYLPYQLTIDGTETTVIPMAPNDAGLQSINIQMSEQQVTDRVSFVHAGNCNIMDKIQGTYRDYVFDLRIEETDRQGILQTCSCCSDIDEILYSQIAYTIPEDKYEWSEDYLEMLGIVRQENPEEDIEAQPTTTTEEHLRTIAGILGKNLVYRGATFYSTADVKEQGGKTYASVISELIGWSSRLPHMEINAYFRGNTLYVIQRGYEANTVSLAGAKIVNVRQNQKLIRTTWGSDVQSESTVDTFINSWQELEQEPYNPSEGGGGTRTYNEDGLVETTTTESESEKTETTYYYETGANGEKYLAYEETVKYELDERGNWQEYDTIVTTHERVSATQSHIYAASEDGTINGEVVSPNRFDDRATPYELGHGGGSNRGFIVLTDGQGNKYKCYSIKYFSKEMEKGTRTTYGLSLVDTSFPVYGEACLTYLTQQLMLLNRKTEETISMDVYDIDHVIGFDDKISFNGATYYLRSNTVLQDERTVNKQSLVMVRWF